MKQRLLISLLSLALGVTSQANAQYNSPTEESADLGADQFGGPELPSGIPTNHVLRPITLPRLNLQGALNVWVAGVSFAGDTEVEAGMDLHVGFGILDNLEVGIASDRQAAPSRINSGFLPVRFTGRGKKFGNLELYGRFRFLSMDSLEIAGELAVEIPSRDTFAFSVAIPMRIRAGNIFALDLGLQARFPFVDVGDSTDLQPQFNVSIQPRLAPIDPLYFGINTGIYNQFAGDGVRQMMIPLGFEGGYTVDVDPVKIEAFASFEFPGFFTRVRTDTGSGGDVVTELWVVQFGGRVFFDFAAS